MLGWFGLPCGGGKPAPRLRPAWEKFNAAWLLEPEGPSVDMAVDEPEAEEGFDEGKIVCRSKDRAAPHNHDCAYVDVDGRG